MVPYRYIFNGRTFRYTFGAHDVCFTNPLFEKFFRLGRTLPLYRFGHGIFQDSINVQIHMLEKHNVWTHIFPEGFIGQDEELVMRFFRWGLARLILEPTVTPAVVPIFFSGFEKVMPDDRKTLRFLPRIGKNIKLTFGQPIDDIKIESFRTRWRELSDKYLVGKHWFDITPDLWPAELRHSTEVDKLRSEVVALARDAVNELRIRSGFAPEPPGAGKVAPYNYNVQTFDRKTGQSNPPTHQPTKSIRDLENK